MSGEGPAADLLFDPRSLSRLLASRRPRVLSEKVAPRRSSVAIVLRASERGPEVLMMKRVRQDQDRWSGQVSFPGGKAEEHDEDSLATAVRETMEEVEIDLERDARLIGRSDDQVAMARGRPLAMAITPWVFELTTEVRPQIGDEAEAVFWLPLRRVLAGELDAPYLYCVKGLETELPSWRYEGFVIWGLTYRMLSALISIARG